MVERIDGEPADHGRADEALLNGTLERALVQVAGEIGGGDEALSGEKTRRGVQGPALVEALLQPGVGFEASRHISRNARDGYISPTGLRNPAVDSSTAM